jgi:hypothetical protein
MPETIIDQYSALSHKAGLDPTQHSDLIPSWVDRDSRRRLTAYRILDSYLGNVARHLQVLEVGPMKAREVREHGDPRLLVNRIVAGVVGTKPSLRVSDSTEPPPLSPELPDEPPDPATVDEALQAVSVAQREVWDQAIAEQTEEWAGQWERWPSVVDAQRWLAAWQLKIRYAAKVYESESTGTVPRGDGVLVMGYAENAAHPSLTVYEPDAYHPVLDDSNDDEFPDTVHLAWEFEDGAENNRKVRRITHQLVDTEPYQVLWSDEPATRVCLLTDKTWQLDAVGLNQWADLDDDKGVPATLSDGTPIDSYRLDIDWIPILHVPNTPSTQTHFGRSSMSNVAQLFDSITAVDTDTEKAAAIAGLPILGVETGSAPASMKLQPGALIPGKITPLDLSASLTSLMALQAEQLERLSINSEVPGPVMGRVNATVVPSGTALALMHAPFESLVETLRLTRTTKYPLIGKWAMRWAMQRGDLELTGDAPEVEALFPDAGIRDLGTIVTWVTDLLAANAISKSTALRVLIDAGVPIVDAQSELDRIVREDLDAAVKVADATGSETAAADRLGIDLEGEPAAVEPDSEPPTFGVPQ